MSLLEKHALDMSEALIQASDLGDLISRSSEISTYLYWKSQVDSDPQVQQLIQKKRRKQELYEECKRFGHYHPSYHSAMAEVNQVQAELEQIEAVQKFKQAEDELDDLLHVVSETIAYAVSDSIKVPSNDPLPTGGCGSGGSCSGKCG